MTKEEIKKEIEDIEAERRSNTVAIIDDRDNLKRLIDEFASNTMNLAEAYADELIDKLNKLLEATNDD